MPAAMTGVPLGDLEATWPLVVPLLEPVVLRSRGKESLVELRAALGAGSRQLWVWVRGQRTPAFAGAGSDGGQEGNRSPSSVLCPPVQALAITDIAVYPAVRICRISICTGERRGAWLAPGLAAIEAWAREQGCDAVEPFCRPGWRRELQGLGYRERHILMRKELPALRHGASFAGLCKEALQDPSCEALEGA